MILCLSTTSRDQTDLATRQALHPCPGQLSAEGSACTCIHLAIWRCCARTQPRNCGESDTRIGGLAHGQPATGVASLRQLFAKCLLPKEFFDATRRFTPRGCNFSSRFVSTLLRLTPADHLARTYQDDSQLVFCTATFTCAYSCLCLSHHRNPESKPRINHSNATSLYDVTSGRCTFESRRRFRAGSNGCNGSFKRPQRNQEEQRLLTACRLMR
jgi:hypothetical protein